MGIMCLKCKHIMNGTSGLHMVTKCIRCGNDDWSQFMRVEDKDRDLEKFQSDKEWLEEHKVINEKSKAI